MESTVKNRSLLGYQLAVQHKHTNRKIIVSTLVTEPLQGGIHQQDQLERFSMK
jgi:hypothetical protein